MLYLTESWYTRCLFFEYKMPLLFGVFILLQGEKEGEKQGIQRETKGVRE
jgi:hypothetical protein